jgi:hypothetical protein
MWYGWHDLSKPDIAIRSAAERFLERYGRLPEACIASLHVHTESVQIGEHTIVVLKGNQPPGIYLVGPIPEGNME